MATNTTLNLARKWRPRNFKEVVGQEMPVSMLRNSLYKDHFFPVYLFAGQKGCGKTSSARILATAANCEKLPDFQKKPDKNEVPCLKCDSCSRMLNGTHADFIEIDAASHTGVDDVRALLESSSFMPLMGRKKIYLVDEAHMLSKAAFNAFLKVLEEPPAQVLFMLATTEIHKIPETVRSRCFQLHFNAIDHSLLHTHLRGVCDQEKIACDDEALTLILHETDGSARDAINLLEQVRFASEKVSSEQVRAALGIMSPHRLGELLAFMVEKKPKKLLASLSELNFTNLNSSRLWQLMLGILRTLIWQTYGITPKETTLLLSNDLRKRIMASASQTRLHSIMQLMWSQEELFLATPYKHTFLEKLFLDICEQINIRDLDALKELVAAEKKTVSSRPAAPAAPHQAAPRPTVSPPTAPTPQPKQQQQAAPAAAKILVQDSGPHKAPWQSFCQQLAARNDPILLSILQQAKVTQVDPSIGTVTVALANASSFFVSKVNDARSTWEPLLRAHFANCSQLVLTGNSAPPAAKKVVRANITPPPPPGITRDASPAPSAWQQHQQQKPRKAALPQRPRGTPLLINEENKDKWPNAHLLVTHFPGRLELLGDKL